MTRPVGSLYFALERTAWSLTRKNWQRDISQAVKDQKLDQSLSAEGNFQAADSDEAIQAKYKTLETFTTNTSSNPKRNTNVRLAAER